MAATQGDPEHRSTGLLARSFLFVPGDRFDRFDRAYGSGAHVVILDLEDGVSPTRKAEARGHVADALRSRRPGRPLVWVRVSIETLREDLDALSASPPQGIVLAKADAAGVDTVWRWVETLGLEPWQRPALIPLIETAAAVQDVRELASANGTTQLMMGEVDLAADLGMNPSPTGTEMMSLRVSLVVASAAAALAAPIGPVWTRLQDMDGLSTHAVRLRTLGFGGMGVIHPTQLDVIHDAFAATPEEIARARRIVEAFDHSVERGVGVLTVPGIGMVDEAVVRQARRVLTESPSPPSPSRRHADSP